MPSIRSFVRPIVLAALAAAIHAPAEASAQQRERPTPHQAIDRVVGPVNEQLAQLHATDAERHDVSDVLARAQTLGAAYVEFEHHGQTERAASIVRRIELLARLVRGRIEAARVEAEAVEREQGALAAEDRRVQARAALERVVERRVELERQPSGEGSATVAPDAADATGSSRAPAAPAGGQHHEAH